MTGTRGIRNRVMARELAPSSSTSGAKMSPSDMCFEFAKLNEYQQIVVSGAKSGAKLSPGEVCFEYASGAQSSDHQQTVPLSAKSDAKNDPSGPRRMSVQYASSSSADSSDNQRKCPSSAKSRAKYASGGNRHNDAEQTASPRVFDDCDDLSLSCAAMAAVETQQHDASTPTPSQYYASTPTSSECGDFCLEGGGDGGCAYQECMSSPWSMQNQEQEMNKTQYSEGMQMQLQMPPGVWMQPVMMPLFVPYAVPPTMMPAEQPDPRGLAVGLQKDGAWQDHHHQNMNRQGGLPTQKKKPTGGAASAQEVDKVKLAVKQNMEAQERRNAETCLAFLAPQAYPSPVSSLGSTQAYPSPVSSHGSMDANACYTLAPKEIVEDRKAPVAKQKSHDASRDVDPMVLELDGPDEKRRQVILGYVSESFWPLALNKRGCRILQKAIDVGSPAYQAKLLENLHGHVHQAMQSLHANYVLQKFIELMPPDNIQFIVAELQGQVLSVARHRFGCRILQRLVEHCTPDQTERMIDILLGDATALLRHSYGNFILQHILQHGSPRQRNAMANVVLVDIIRLSKHRLASHVVSCALIHCSTEDVQRLTNALLNDEAQLAQLARREYGSFVVREAHRALRLLKSNGMIAAGGLLAALE